jgi:N-methylhydantoinase B/oxoprolinase/acetone carboxylase alpha subunit
MPPNSQPASPPKIAFLRIAWTPQLPSTTWVTPQSTASDISEIASSSVRPFLRAKGQQTVPKGDALIIEMPGGGGLGDPARRAPELVRDDVRLGLVSREAAVATYGVVIGDDLAIDWPATEAARQAAAE